MRLLVVDDDPDCVTTLAALLADEGFEVTTASDGHEALEQMQAQAPDALITDLDMPGLDGFALLRQVRQRMPGVLVVVISGAHHGAASVFEGGALAYVGKPIQVDEVVSALDAGLQMRDDRWLERPISSMPPRSDS